MLGFGNVAAPPPLNVVAVHVGEVSTAEVQSLYVPVAVKVSVVPLVIDGAAGVTAIDTSAAALTVRVAGVAAVTPFSEALIFVLVPMAASVLVASPGVVVLIVTPLAEDVHVTLEVMF